MKEVWISSVMSNGELGNKLGIREKFYGHDWEEPTHIVPRKPDGVFENMLLHAKGIKLSREIFPEASYIFDEKRFNRSKDFFWAGGFMAIKGKLADVLKTANLGNTELVPYPIYEMDKKTKLPGPFYLLNFGEQKNSFLPHESENVRPFYTVDKDGIELWKAKFEPADNEIAVSALAIEGPDIWFEPKCMNKIFMSGALAHAIQEARIKVDFGLAKCRVVA